MTNFRGSLTNRFFRTEISTRKMFCLLYKKLRSYDRSAVNLVKMSHPKPYVVGWSKFEIALTVAQKIFLVFFTRVVQVISASGVNLDLMNFKMALSNFIITILLGESTIYFMTFVWPFMFAVGSMNIIDDR